jgi:hypothetical protein
MTKAAITIGAILIGGVVFLAMFPVMKLGININTTGWIDLFKVMARFLPYVLIVMFILWVLAKVKDKNGS